MKYFKQFLQYSKFFISLFVISHLQFSLVYATPKLIPGPQQYQAFLLKPWRSNAKTLVVFKDPYCSYCQVALKKLNRLGNYNVFMFWSPILGQRSVYRVNDIFYCDSPIGKQVLDGVVNNKPFACDGKFNKKLFQLNNQIVINYDPQSVPQYYLGGRQVSLSQLDLRSSLPDLTTNLKVDWSRYSLMAVNSQQDGPSVALLLPEEYVLSDQQLQTLRKQERFNWYLFWRSKEGGDNGLESEKKYNERLQEFLLLMGVDKIVKPMFIYEGRVLSELTASKYLSKSIVELF